MVQMTRRVTFSSGHRYWFASKTEAENKAIFGEWASPYNHGHNFILDVTVAGEVNPADGMVVNIKRVDDILKAQVTAKFDQKSVNDQVPGFDERAPTLENLLLYLRAVLHDVFEVPRYHDNSDGGSRHVRLTRLRLEEMPRLWAELELETDLMTLTRTYEFAASHRLNAVNLSADENRLLYGKCNNPAGHGHNYVLEVSVTGKVDEVTGMMVDLGGLDARVEEVILSRYDHKNLDVDVPELVGKVTTSEVVAQTIFDQLVGTLPADLVKIKLWETARNAFEVSRS